MTTKIKFDFFSYDKSDYFRAYTLLPSVLFFVYKEIGQYEISFRFWTFEFTIKLLGGSK